MSNKTSQARILHARLNPINAQEKEVLRLFNESGKKFKDFVVDIVLDTAGYTPQNFSNDRVANGTSAVIERLDRLSSQMDSMMAEMVQEIIDNLQASGKFVKTRHDDDDDKDDSGISPFARNFGRSFLERQQGDE